MDFDRNMDPYLAAELSDFTTLEDVMRWMKRKGVPLRCLERVAMDEYSHDVFLPLPGQWLVFGCTWLGTLTAVAVWNHKPTADDLLQRRIEQGWTPIPSPLKDGPRVLGHACRLSP